MISFLVSYYTKLSVSTSVESIIFVLKKITALKKGVRICPTLPYMKKFTKKSTLLTASEH